MLPLRPEYIVERIAATIDVEHCCHSTCTAARNQLTARTGRAARHLTGRAAARSDRCRPTALLRVVTGDAQCQHREHLAEQDGIEHRLCRSFLGN
jgi:hypothetical protein